MSIVRSHRANQSAVKKSGERRDYKRPSAVALFDLLFHCISLLGA
jgi:hypothetical protein